MSEISLRDYLKKLDRLIERNSLEEALAHTRYILEHYPKNTAAYRSLARILALQGRWEEANDVYRRLLGAIPNDFAAHFQISFGYERLNQPDLALWHLERAFDEQPNNKLVIDRLRELYERYRGQKLERVQLTAGAVAGQYVQSGLFDQAVETLRRAIERMPDRDDLRLQLARALWYTGRVVDAAEVSMEVLRKQPYALAANQMLAELWL